MLTGPAGLLLAAALSFGATVHLLAAVRLLAPPHPGRVAR